MKRFEWPVRLKQKRRGVLQQEGIIYLLIQTEKFHTPKLTTKHHTSRIKVLYLLKNLNIKEI